jgi:glycosyl transferase family 25
MAFDERRKIVPTSRGDCFLLGIAPDEATMSTNPQGRRLTAIVISLPDSTSRRQIIKEYLSRIDLPWSFFEAKRYIFGASEENNIDIGKDLSEGEVGCFLSHLSVWKEIMAMDVDYAIVLEDDTVLIPSLDYHALFALLRDFGIDFIRLTARRIDRAVHLAHLESQYGLLGRITAPKYNLGTGCYALTPRAASVFCAAVSRIEQPIDHWLERFRNHGIPIYDLFPPSAIEIRSQTTIRHTPHRCSTGLFAYLLRRIARLFADGLDEWRLTRRDNALRRRIERLRPGVVAWPRAELRKHLRQLLRPWNSKDF